MQLILGVVTLQLISQQNYASHSGQKHFGFEHVIEYREHDVIEVS